MDRNIPKIFVCILLNWYSKMETVVRWGSAFSRSVRLSAGVRQGSVLAPSLFSIFVDNILVKLSHSSLGCYIKGLCFNAIMYADDLLLLTLSISDLHKLIIMCREEFSNCNLTLNNNKSVCLRIGPRHAADSVSVTIGTDRFLFKKELKYLGCTILSGPSFACSLQGCKQKFFGSANGIFGKVGATPDSHQLILSLINSFCLPLLLYGFEDLKTKH